MLREAEVWKVSKEYKDYAVSSFGQVKRITVTKGTGGLTQVGRLLKPCQNTWGYVQVWLKDIAGRVKPVTVHQLVMLVFKGPCPKGKEVNHKDGVKANCKLSNLEYVTKLRNQQHAVMLGLHLGYTTHKLKPVEREEVVLAYRHMKGRRGALSELGRRFSVTPQAIQYLVKTRS